MSDLRCSPYSGGMNIVTAFLEAKNQMSLAPCSAAEAMSEAPAPVSEAPQSKAESPAKTPSVSLVSPPSEAETLQAVEKNPLDFHFLSGFSSETSEFFSYASNDSEMAVTIVDLQHKTQRVHSQVTFGEIQSKGNLDPSAGGLGMDVSANTIHFSQTDQKKDGSSISTDIKILEAHGAWGVVNHEDGSQTTKIGVGASLWAIEQGYDSGDGRSVKLGLSAGIGAGLSVTTKDSDKDGLGEACVGAEVGPISFELCGENTPAQQAWENKFKQTENMGDRLLMLGELPGVLLDGVF